jgi:monoamine oxidase
MYAEHRAARASGLPVEAVRAGELRPRVSRRAFLSAAGAGAATLALPRAARAGQPSIAIVGGGIAGLTCALKLADRGVASTVYEASARAGGRMFSNTGYFAQGQVAEWCGELIDTGHKTVRHLAQRFNLTLDDLRAAEAPGSEDTYYWLFVETWAA